MGCGPSKDIFPLNRSNKGFLLEAINDHQSGVNCMVLSDDESLLVTGSDDLTARMWSTKSDPVECLGVLEGHEGYITCCIVYEQFVMTGSSDCTIRMWLIATADCLHVFRGHDSRISRITCFGNFMFSSSNDKTARAWSFDGPEHEGGEDATCIQVFEGHSKGVYPLLYIPPTTTTEDINSSRSGIVLTGSADCTARSWSFDSGQCLHVFRGHTAPLNCIEADDTKKMIYTAGGDAVIRSWNVLTGECIRELRGHEGAIFCLLVHKRMLYSAGSDKTARAWAMEFGECMRVYRGHRHTVSSLRYYDGLLYTGCGDCAARMYEAKSGTLKRVFRGHQNAIVCIEVVPGKLFTGSYDGAIRVWDTTGVRDETVFGADSSDYQSQRDDDEEEDSEEVRQAVKCLDPYIRD